MKNFNPDDDILDRRILYEITGRPQDDDELYSEDGSDFDDEKSRGVVEGPLKLGRQLREHQDAVNEIKENIENSMRGTKLRGDELAAPSLNITDMDSEIDADKDRRTQLTGSLTQSSKNLLGVKT